MKARGPNRKFNPNIPEHIDQAALPKRCYWDNSGNGHWFTTFKDETGKLKRKLIAYRDATLSDLHRLIEEFKGVNRESFRYLADTYFENSNFADLSKSTRESYEYAFKNICDYVTKTGESLADIPLNHWDSYLVQKFIDTMRLTPSKAKHTHTFIRRVFSWSKNRGFCSDNPAIGTELPKERKEQTLPTQSAYDRLKNYARANGTYGNKFKGSCPHYIWAVMEINYLCYLRGIETRNLNDAHIKDNVLVAERRKGSGTNLVEFNSRLTTAINHLIECRTAIWERKRITIPLRPEDRPIVVNTLGEKLKSDAYQSAWGRFINARIKDGLIDTSERFSLHDLKRKGVTDTDQENAAEHKDPRMKDIYDKSIRTVKPASE